MQYLLQCLSLLSLGVQLFLSISGIYFNGPIGTIGQFLEGPTQCQGLWTRKPRKNLPKHELRKILNVDNCFLYAHFFLIAPPCLEMSLTYSCQNNFINRLLRLTHLKCNSKESISSVNYVLFG